MPLALHDPARGVAPWLLLAVLTTACAPEPAPLSSDFDSDGSTDDRDCAPANPAIYVGADDAWGDGIDQDCDGADGRDLDGDGLSDLAVGAPGSDLGGAGSGAVYVLLSPY